MFLSGSFNYASNVLFSAEYHLFVSPAKRWMEESPYLNPSQLYRIAYLDVCGSEGFRVPGLCALALGTVVPLGVTAGAYGSYDTPERFTAIDGRDDP